MRACSGSCAYHQQFVAPEHGLLATMRSWVRRAVSEYTHAHTPARPYSYQHVEPELSVQRLLSYYELRLPLLPPTLHDVIRPLPPDEETQSFLDSCRPNVCISWLAHFLRLFFSVTDVNAMLRRGGMFVLSSAHARQLLAPEHADVEAGDARAASHADAHPHTHTHTPVLGSLLDIGAGDGGVTAKLAPLFRDVTVTEVSHYMARRLRERGWRVVETPFLTEDMFPRAGVYDVVSIFNVLDRCDHPADMLRAAIRLMKPGTGRLLLAVVLPFSEFVEDGKRRRNPKGALPMRGKRCQDGVSFEDSLAALVTRVLIPLGLDVERIAKVPYLCSGDNRRPYYVLADAIIVCKYNGRPEQPLGESATTGTGVGGLTEDDFAGFTRTPHIISGSSGASRRIAPAVPTSSSRAAL